MGNLDDFSLDQMAGASALIISSVGGLLLIIFKSRCKKISCCWGLINCDRVVQDEENSDDDDDNNDKDKDKDNLVSTEKNKKNKKGKKITENIIPVDVP